MGHAQGRAVLVPRALPGERLEVEPVRVAKGVVHARPLRVLEAAPERIDPPCRYFGRCGGCHYQHLDIEHQVSWKAEILRETLRRIGKITWESEITIHQASPWNYRNQAQLKVVHNESGETALGFFEGESHHLVSIDECLILSSRLNQALGQLRQPQWLSRLRGCREIELLANEQDDQVRITLQGTFGPGEAEPLARDLLQQVEGTVAVAFQDGRRMQRFGESAFIYRVGEFKYQLSPGSFFQSSCHLLPELVAAVTDAAPGDLALDLYAGAGLFTLPLARRFKQVIGVESQPGAARDLGANVGSHGLKNVRAVGQPAFDFLRRFAQTGPDLVILDPPRSGVGPSALKYLVDLRPQRIHYVACHPPTWARDLAYLLGQDYRLEGVEMFDCFPQTYHIECLARLVRQDQTA